MTKDLLPTVTRWACEHCDETFDSAKRVGRHKRDKHSSITVQEKVVRDKTHPVCPESHGKVKLVRFENDFDQSWEFLFGMAKGLVRTTFRNRVKNILKREYPNLRRSAARTVMEGHLRIGCPSITIPITHSHRINMILDILDVFETMVHLEHEKKPDPFQEHHDKLSKETDYGRTSEEKPESRKSQEDSARR